MFCAYSMLDTIESALKWVCVSWVDIMQLRRESGMEHKSPVGNGSSPLSPGEALYAIEVYWNGRRITQGELLQIWDRFSSGQMNSTQANAFVKQFCDRNGQRLTTKKLGELVKYIIQSSQLSLMLQQHEGGSGDFDLDPAFDLSTRPMSLSSTSGKHRDSVNSQATEHDVQPLEETANEQSRHPEEAVISKVSDLRMRWDTVPSHPNVAAEVLFLFST